MPQQPRLLLSHSYYHIITRGNNGKVIFKNNDDYQYYLHLIERFKKELSFDLYHYCLMPTHVHKLVRTHNSAAFSAYMKKINLAYFYYYKQKYKWNGHFWQGRFRSQPVGNDEYFIQCGKYIESNPVRAKIVESPSHYEFSSFNFYSKGTKNILLTIDPNYEGMGKDERARRKQYADMVIDDLINESYLKKVWGTHKQIHNEIEKIRYHRA